MDEAQDSASDCLDHETVQRLFEGQLSEEEQARVDEHMDGCSACRGLVAKVAQSSGVDWQASGARPTASTAALDVEALLDEDLPAGHLLGGRFRVVRKLGRGAMGVVYEAEDGELGVRLAVKLLPREAAGNARLIERLRNEIVLGRRVTHPNVCRLYDLGTERGVPFITMEYVVGETLAERMRRGLPPEEEAVRILLQVCDALEAAHAHGVVHRDLKPSNIMVAKDGRVAVMDFGLARDLNAERSERGLLIGTPAYWSPEQARGERATHRSDLYTLGAIACELLGGGRPGWDAEPSIAGVRAIYRDALLGCLRLRPEQRFGSARELRDTLVAATSGERKKPKRRWVAVVFFVLGVAVAAAGTWALGQSGGDDADDERRPAASPTENERSRQEPRSIRRDEAPSVRDEAPPSVVRDEAPPAVIERHGAVAPVTERAPTREVVRRRPESPTPPAGSGSGSGSEGRDPLPFFE